MKFIFSDSLLERHSFNPQNYFLLLLRIIWKNYHMKTAFCLTFFFLAFSVDMLFKLATSFTRWKSEFYDTTQNKSEYHPCFHWAYILVIMTMILITSNNQEVKSIVSQVVITIVEGRACLGRFVFDGIVSNGFTLYLICGQQWLH